MQKKHRRELGEHANSEQGQAALDASSQPVFQHFDPGRREANSQGNNHRP
jgi:hypothetical protein